jgi:hypothetical protein
MALNSSYALAICVLLQFILGVHVFGVGIACFLALICITPKRTRNGSQSASTCNSES